MQIGSVITQGLIGMQTSQAEMTRSATQIAEASSPRPAASDSRQTNDVVEPLINLQLQSQLFDSSARVVQVADEVLGTLLDTKA